ncbi:MAG: GGDEF domain-containing protein, partial [Actinomycetota bacterium]
VDRTALVARLDRSQERPDGPAPEVQMGLTPTSGDSTEPAETVLFFVRLAQIHDFEVVHGHKAGQELATEVGKRLSATIRPGDTVARLGTTDFVLRCHPVSAIQAESIVARLLNNLWDPVVTRWEETRLRPRVGMVRAGDPTPLSALVGEAERAMARADKVGRDWLWAGQEVDIRPAELGPAPDPAGFGAGTDA